MDPDPPRKRGRPRNVDFSERQRHVLRLLAARKTNGEIAAELGVSLDGVKYHVREICDRLGVDTREEAAEWWRQEQGLGTRFRLFRRPGRKSAALRWGVAGATTVTVAVVVVVVLALFSGGEADPSHPEPGANETPTDASPGEGPLLIYGRVLGRGLLPDAGGRSGGTMTVLVHDLSTGTVEASFDIPRVLAGPRTLLLRGDSIYANQPDRVVEYGLDGAERRTVASAPEGRVIHAFDVTPDGTRIAYWLGSTDPDDFSMQLMIADTATGGVLAEVASEAMTAVSAFGQSLRWEPGGASLLVAVGRSHSSKLYAVGVDGSVHDFGLGELSAAVAPNMATAFHPVSAHGGPSCPVTESKDGEPIAHPRMILDLRSRQPIWQADGDQVPWAAISSSDGSSYLLGEYECMEDEPQPAWSVVTIQGPEPTRVPDPVAVLRDWYGERLVTSGCERSAPVFAMLPFDHFGETVSLHSGALTCYEGLHVGDQLVDAHDEIVVLGIQDRGDTNDP
jgi:DNA-binding CsgD family transcriptional regulator